MFGENKHGYLQCEQTLVDFSAFHSCLSVSTGRVGPTFITCNKSNSSDSLLTDDTILGSS